MLDPLLTAVLQLTDEGGGVASSARPRHRARLQYVLRVVCGALAQQRGLSWFAEEPQAIGHERPEMAASLHIAIEQTLKHAPDLLSQPALLLGDLYQGLLDRDGGERRSGGCYYTPTALVEQVLDAALSPVLDRLEPRSDREAALVNLRLCDPACGSGGFLVAAARRLAQRLAEWRGDPSSPGIRSASVDVVKNCIHGMDTDPIAVDLARFALEMETANAPGSPRVLSKNITRGNSLFDLARRPEFDVVVGNPPFVNMIDGGVSPRDKRRMLAASPLLSGTADLAFHFVHLADQIAHERGTVGLVLPKTFLNAPAARRLRAHLSRSRPPSAIIIPAGERHFRGAATYVGAVILGGGTPCRVSLDGRDSQLAWPTETDAGANWWRVISTAASSRPTPAPDNLARLGDRFLVTAGMTTGEAYAIRAYLADAADGDALRLITSRLIDPDRCRWGEVACRYLGRTLMHPRLALQSSFPAALQRRLAAARRPKLLVAGLANRFEAYVDDRGSDLGAVSTFVIFDPHDDCEALRQLCRWLHSPDANDWLRGELGAASVGHGYMTLTKRALQQLPLPAGLGKMAA